MKRPKTKILVIEDEPDVCHSVRSYLGRRGFLISTTSSGKEAVKMLEASPQDIIILDLCLPDMSGQEVLRDIRKKDQKTKIIIMTGKLLTKKEIDKVHDLGISEFLYKPILLEDLQNSISAILGKKIKPKSDIYPRKRTRPAAARQKRFVHELSNLLGIIRNKGEGYLLDLEEGMYQRKSNKEVIQISADTMRVIIETVDRAVGSLRKISNTRKKK